MRTFFQDDMEICGLTILDISYPRTTQEFSGAHLLGLKHGSKTGGPRVGLSAWTRYVNSGRVEPELMLQQKS